MNRKAEHKIATEALSTKPGAAKDQDDILYVIGVDEAGRGPLCGPVVAAACVMPMRNDKAYSSKHLAAKPLTGHLHDLGDSKKLPEPTRDRIGAELVRQAQQQQQHPVAVADHCIGYGTCRVEAGEIDSLNILEASLHGMERAVDGAIEHVQKNFFAHHKKKFPPISPKNCVVLVDGPHLPRHLRSTTATDVDTKAQKKKQSSKKSAKKVNPKAEREAEARARIIKPLKSLSFVPAAKAVVRGDSVCASISAASVLAKVERDRIMTQEVAPAMAGAYGVAQNKGYPTAAHRAALLKHGVTKFHRVSYAPVREAMEKKMRGKATKKNVSG